jgi:hypothetical protein
MHVEHVQLAPPGLGGACIPAAAQLNATGVTDGAFVSTVTSLDMVKSKVGREETDTVLAAWAATSLRPTELDDSLNTNKNLGRATISIAKTASLGSLDFGLTGFFVSFNFS